MNTKKSQVVLAIDPMDPARLSNASFKRFSQKFSLSLHSITILKSPSLPKSQDLRLWEKKVARIVSKFGVSSSKVALSLGGTREEVVNVFLQSLSSFAADSVALFSHGRSGLSRWVLGSFAEALLWKSTVPLLFFPKTWSSKNSDRSILFSTDFSEDSARQLEYFLSRFPVEKVSVFHSVHFPVPYAAFEAPPQFSPDFFRQQESRAKKQFQLWQKRFSSFPIDLEFVMQSSKIGFLSGDEILSVASEQKVDMVVLSAQADVLQRFFFGSAAFDLFRKNRLPIFVFGPKFKMPTRSQK